MERKIFLQKEDILFNVLIISIIYSFFVRAINQHNQDQTNNEDEENLQDKIRNHWKENKDVDYHRSKQNSTLFRDDDNHVE